MSHWRLNQILEIPRTLAILTECWEKAESQLQLVLQSYSPDTNEDYVTRRFHEEYSSELKKASEKKLVEKAFSGDLERAFRGINLSHSPTQIAQGIIADVTLHEKKTEEGTGGDFGLVLIRPKTIAYGDSITFKSYRRGLLCQAKIKRESGKFGELSENQVDLFEKHQPYSSLLIYDFSDAERRLLKPFKWQLYNAATSVQDVKDWLHKNKFPFPANSKEVIAGIGRGKIGTSDPKTINEYITPTGNVSLIVTVYWPPGKGPGSNVRVLSRKETQSEVKLYVGDG